MDKKDFIETENYNLKLRGLGGKKVANEFSSMMNQTVGLGIHRPPGGLFYL
jgi:hypothetical protein